MPSRSAAAMISSPLRAVNGLPSIVIATAFGSGSGSGSTHVGVGRLGRRGLLGLRRRGDLARLRVVARLRRRVGGHQ